MALANGDPSLLQPLAGGVAALGVEVMFGVLHEGARTLDDLLDRRVRLGLVPAERRAAEEAAARLVD
jgi:glycerol-3-phosphate dehydrogenase